MATFESDVTRLSRLAFGDGPTTLHVAICPRCRTGIVTVHEVRVHDARRFVKEMRSLRDVTHNVIAVITAEEAERLRHLRYDPHRVHAEVEDALGHKLNEDWP